MQVTFNEILAPHTTLGIGGPADRYAEPHTIDELKDAIKQAQDAVLPIFILGAGSNTLIHDDGFRGFVIHPAMQAITWHDDGETVTVDAGDSAYGQSFAISGFTPVADDNIVIADAVYNAGLNVNEDGTMVTDDLATGTTDSGFNGVPTMFRHLLSQVTFTIGLATTTPTVGTTNYSATIKSFTVKSAANTGSLSLTAGASSGTALNVQPWTPAADGTQVGWTASATADLAFTAPTAALTLAAGQTTGNIETVVENRTVLPQALADAVVLEIVYDLQTKHGNTVYASEENVKVTAQLNTLTIKNWCMNQRVIYNVTINPVTGLVKFDPAVAAWTTATAVAVTL